MITTELADLIRIEIGAYTVAVTRIGGCGDLGCGLYEPDQTFSPIMLLSDERSNDVCLKPEKPEARAPQSSVCRACRRWRRLFEIYVSFGGVPA